MDLTVLLPLGGVVLGAVATWLGSFLTDRRAHQRAVMERREDRRAEIRKVTVDLVESGIEFASFGFIDVLTQVPNADSSEHPKDLHKKYGDEFRAAQTAHSHALTVFLVTVSDTEAVAAVRSLQAEMARLSEVTTPAMVKALRGERASSAELKAISDYFNAYRAQVNNVQIDLAPFTAQPLKAVEG